MNGSPGDGIAAMAAVANRAYHRRVISHDLHALGFDAPDLDSLVNSAAQAGAVGVEDVGGFDLLAAYSDPSGARLAMLSRDGEMDTMASLVAPTTHAAEVRRYRPTVALVELVEGGSPLSQLAVSGASGGVHGKRVARFLANADDPVEYPLCAEPGDDTSAFVQHLRVGAVANGFIRVHDSEEAYGASEEGGFGPRSDIQFSAGHLISPWLMELEAGRASRAEVSAVAEMTMVVDQCEKRTNELTGEQWWRCMGKVGFPLTLALPAGLPTDPHPGSVLSGQVVPVISSGTWEGDALWG